MTGVLTRIQAQLHPTDDAHHVTTLELLFDLVFVYCITNVTSLMEHSVGARAVVEGLVMLSIVWFGWCSYAWLGNQARADEGLLRLAMIVAMGGMFFVAISIPSAFAEHGNAAIVLAFAYAVVRLVHIGVYLVAAGDDRNVRSVILGMLVVSSVSLVPLFVGALAGERSRLWWWLGSVLIDQLGVYFVRSSRWVLRSASHFSERFGLIVLIAVGESIVDIGTAAQAPQLDAHRAFALLFGLAVAVCLWWTYFDVVALVAERVLAQAHGIARARLARDSYTYLHLPMVAGIVFVALGLHLLIARDHVDAGRYALYGGVAVYLAAHVLFRRRNIGSINIARAVVGVALLIAIPAARPLPSLGQLALPAVLLVALIGYEVNAHKQWRAEVRGVE